MPVMTCYMGTFLSINIGLGNISITTVMDSGFFEYSKSFSKVLHSHTNNELFFIADGSCDILTDDGVLTPRKKTIVLIPSETNHCIMRKGEAGNFKCFRFSLSKHPSSGNDVSTDLYDLFYNFAVKEHKIVVIDACAGLFDLFELIWAELYNQKLMFLENFECILKQFYIEFFRTIAGHGQPQDEKKETLDIVPHDVKEWNQVIAGTYKDYLVDIIDCYINMGFRNNITVVELADALKLSVSQTKRLIKENYGDSFGNLVIKKRMSVAMAMIRDSKPRSLQMISELVGYESYNGFFNAFRQLMGETPTEYAKRMKRRK